MNTQQLIAADKAYVWHPFTPMKPWCERDDLLVIERGEREFLITTDGERYIDGSSSLWCNVHGHNHPAINRAVIDQLEKVAHSTLLGLANVPSVQLAERLVKLAQSRGLALSKVFYSDNGSTAVEVACKMAYQYWKNLAKDGRASGNRSKFLALENAYHGDTIGAVSVGSIPIFHHAFKSLCFHVDFVPPPQKSCAIGTPVTTDESLAAMERLLTAQPGEYAAIVIEPLIQGAGGMITHPADFLPRVRALADRHNVLLIADEVMTGFGRTGRMFACESEGNSSSVSPDLMCLSKGLTAGYMPLGVTLTSQKVYDAFYADPAEGKTFFHGHTFTGHPLACAAALASLDLFESTDLLGHVHRLTPILEETLEIARKKPFVGDVRSCGLIGAIELVDEPRTAATAFPYQWRVGGAVSTQMRKVGLLMRPLADVLVLMPPLAIEEKSFRRLCAGVLESLSWVVDIVAGKRGQ